MIKLFKKDETQFTHDGVEVLDDIVISSYTSWTENSKWVIEAKFKKDFDKSEAIEEGMFLQVPTEKGLQLFRILKVSKKNKKYITVSGYQIGFDFDDNFIQDINIVEKSGRAAIKQIQGGTVYTNKFNLSSNIDTVASARMVRKNGIDALLGSDDNTFVNRWGGYLVLDNFNISMNESVGEDRGVEILVGKNVIDFEGSIDISSVVTGINAITYDGLTLPDGIYYSPLVNNYPHPKIQEFKFDNIKYKYSEHGSEDGYETLEEVYEALRKECDKLFEEQNIDKPTCSLRLSIAELSKTDQYKGDELNERIYQGDILTANLDDYGFNVKLKMTANKYNNIKDRYEDIDLGDVKGNALSNIKKVQNVIDKVVEQLGGNSWQDILDKSMDEATQLIEAGIKDSYVVARKNEILIMDSPQVESSINVIRMNKNGIAFSQSGYNGPYTLAITIDGKINASCITTGELNAALIKTGTIMSANGNLAISVDDGYLQVTHTESATKTRIDSEGFSIIDENDDVLAWLSSKKQWSELKADKVFANNIENVYEGAANLYVDHSKAVAGDGSSKNPFNSFAALKEHLEQAPVINKDLFITVRDPGFVINERLVLTRLKGTGYIKIILEGKLVISGPGNGQYAIHLTQIPKWVWIVGFREFGSATTGPVIGDRPDGGGGHGVYAADVSRLEIDAITIACQNWGINTERTHLYTWHCDFCKCYNAVELRYQSIYYSSDDVGSCTDWVRLSSGSFAYWGCGTVRPQGLVQQMNGVYYGGNSNLTPTASSRYSSTPSPPQSGQNVFTYTYNWTSHKTYAYQWNNWSDGDCKQGAWGYGLRGGHMFFDLATIRSQMNGTVLDGNTITLTRATSGGLSGDSNVYINGSICSSPSGTPSYGGQTLLGTLKWGETKTFTLPKAIVQGLVNGTYNSLAIYVNSSANNCYINIVNCSITLKVSK